jgi:hypothetical protein
MFCKAAAMSEVGWDQSEAQQLRAPYALTGKLAEELKADWSCRTGV